MGLFSFSKKNNPSQSGVTAWRYVSRTNYSKHRSHLSAALFDPTLPKKQHARWRLVRSILLVLISAVALLVILDSDQNPLIDNVSIQILYTVNSTP
ncbi:hypothetical protein GJV44_00618 [Candidatus Vallotia cooleyia]|nr:hypothetical protein GJV44_00618 [Candidatus Vallotia cooleyia]